MLKGLIRVLDWEQMTLLHAGILRVLETTGLQIRGEFLLHALADAGCRVDFRQRRAWFRPDFVEKQIAAQAGRYRLVRSSLWYPHCRSMPEQDVAWPDDFVVDFGHGAPWYADYAQNRYRPATLQDQLEMIRLGNALPEVKAVNAPFICSDFDPRLETIESARALILNTGKPGWVGTSCGREVKYLAELAALATDGRPSVLRSQPPFFVHAYCTTSPLKLGPRSCEVLEQALPYRFPVNFASMPIMGSTTPVTPAGSVVVAGAEILGAITAASLLAPDAFFYSTSITGEMDMKTTRVCYSTPAAVLTDAALHQLFRARYGLVHCVEPAYIEAKAPGLQASFMRIFRQLALGCTASLSLPIGLLDNGSAFSPVQAMLDLDTNRALYGFARGLEVNEDTMALNLINDLGFCERGSYLESEHTLEHFRSVLWDPLFLERRYRAESEGLRGADEPLLRKADCGWRELVASSAAGYEREPGFRAEVERIVEAARRELLTAPA